MRAAFFQNPSRQHPRCLQNLHIIQHHQRLQGRAGAGAVHFTHVARGGIEGKRSRRRDGAAIVGVEAAAIDFRGRCVGDVCIFSPEVIRRFVRADFFPYSGRLVGFYRRSAGTFVASAFISL